MAEERKRLTVPDLKARKKANEKVVMVSIPDYPVGRMGRAGGHRHRRRGRLARHDELRPSQHAARHRRHDDPARAGRASRRAQLHGAGRHAVRQLRDGGDRRAQCLAHHEGGRRRRRQDAGRPREGAHHQGHRRCGRAGHEPRRHVSALHAPLRRLQAAGQDCGRGACASSTTAWPSRRRVRAASRSRRCRLPSPRPWTTPSRSSPSRIGAGSASCGQLLLGYDLLGVFDQFKPKFTKRYAELSKVAVDALKTYAAEVRAGKFPDADHAYGMKAEEVDRLQR